jgi:Zn-finger nucleic acid-binding protein
VLCPVCNLDQVIVEWGDVELDVCIDGCGIWFDAEELRHLFAAAGAPDFVTSLERRLQALPKGHRGPKRRCPRCRAGMEHVTAPHHPEQIILDRCAHGHGIWFDEGELEQLVGHELDADDPQLARVRAHLMRFLRPDAGDRSPTHNREPEA